MSNKVKAIFWVMGGLAFSKILNEILYPFFNSPSMGIDPLRAFIPALLASLFLIFCLYKAYTTYKKNDVDVHIATKHTPPSNDRYESDRLQMLRDAQFARYLGNSKLVALLAVVLIVVIGWLG